MEMKWAALGIPQKMCVAWLTTLRIFRVILASLLPCMAAMVGRHASAWWLECSAGFCKRVIGCSVYTGRGVPGFKLLVILFMKLSHVNSSFISNEISRHLTMDFCSTSWLHPGSCADSANDDNSQSIWCTAHVWVWTGRTVHEANMHSGHKNKLHGCFVCWYDADVQIADILHACCKSQHQPSHEFGGRRVFTQLIRLVYLDEYVSSTLQCDTQAWTYTAKRVQRLFTALRNSHKNIISRLLVAG